MTAALLDTVVHAQSRASDRTLLLELRSSGGGPLPAAEPGSHVDVHLESGSGPLVRQYSLLDVTDRSRYLICVQHEPGGRGGSRHVHERLRVGDRLRVSAPRNTFRLEEAPHHAVLVGGGIGVTPLLAMAGALHARGASYELHCYARGAMPLAEYAASRPFADRVRARSSADGDSVRAAPPDWRLTPDGVVYACGPPGFLDAVTRHATAAGLPGSAVRTERFGPAEPTAAGGAFTVVAASTGERMTVAEDQTIAEVLERHGYGVVLSCEQGICGSCLTPVLEGVPDHRDEVQTPAEHASGTWINPCVSRALTAAITLEV
ncbi:PDR/VanB family oxidoreductase [Actinomadura sp. DC4]|uniref:PDR/VanB family oxidoreductase n=1 Tax=Actinomadura sp. DC4 TaxID=3055069 RepID=UPI0025B27936|nr:PDR/VanB family oxidoreductase [Actinomadura sp. DC4]MDN3356308.1 PDR/VanB family oxidoreductase [Actinomadura sp. DC4]